MPQARKYATNAERQKAYRKRAAQKAAAAAAAQTAAERDRKAQ